MERGKMQHQTFDKVEQSLSVEDNIAMGDAHERERYANISLHSRLL